MGELKDHLLKEVELKADQLRMVEQQLDKARQELHDAIRAAGHPDLEKPEQSGPSAIARATRHRYTREYVGTLLKSAGDADVVLTIPNPETSVFVQVKSTHSGTPKPKP